MLHPSERFLAQRGFTAGLEKAHSHPHSHTFTHIIQLTVKRSLSGMQPWQHSQSIYHFCLPIKLGKQSKKKAVGKKGENPQYCLL